MSNKQITWLAIATCFFNLAVLIFVIQADGMTQRKAQQVTRFTLQPIAALTAVGTGHGHIWVGRCRFHGHVASCPFTVTSRVVRCRGRQHVRERRASYNVHFESLNCQERA
jgi:hypothetical protein